MPYSSPHIPASKIMPSLPRSVVSRWRLLRQLSEAVERRRVVLVVAPGGSGKTVLLADWARQTPRAVAWFALDRADLDLRRQAYGLCAAVERGVPGAAQAAVTALDQGTSELAAIGLLLDALGDSPLVLVVDDFHYLDNVPEAVAFWDHFLRFAPPRLSLVLLTRTIPTLTLTGLAALGEAEGLGSSDLRFNVPEAELLLGAHGLEREDCAQHVKRSGGWAAGVLLLARTESSNIGFLRARTESLMSTLGAEVLAPLPAELRSFLMESAALGSVTAAEADAILDIEYSAALFADAAARGLFIDEQEGGYYRFHDLFADFLIGLLRKENAGRLRAIRRAAAARWETSGDLPRALDVLALDHDWEQLTDMLDRNRTVLWERGLAGTILMHVEALPAEYRTVRLLTLAGHARFQRGELGEALQLADAGLAGATTETEWLGPSLLRAQALLQLTRYEDFMRCTDAILSTAERVGHERAQLMCTELRGMALLALGQLDEGQAQMETVLRNYHAQGDTTGESRIHLNIAERLVVYGRVKESETHLVQAESLWRRDDYPQLASLISYTRALSALTRGDYDIAERAALVAVEDARALNLVTDECQALAVLARVYADRGQGDEADHCATSVVDMAWRLDLVEVVNRGLQIRIHAALLRRDRTLARELIMEAQRTAQRPQDEAHVLWLDGVLALRCGAWRRAIDLLGQAVERLEACNQPHDAARALLLQAEAYIAAGTWCHAETALNRMTNALSSLGCEGYIQACARWAPRVIELRRKRQRLTKATRRLLDTLAAGRPALTLLAAEPPAPPVLHISPFGPGRAQLGEHELALATLPPKARELLFFMAQAGTALPRDAILDAVWDGGMEVAAFWEAGRHLRRVLGDAAWKKRNGLYALTVDVVDESKEVRDLAVMAARGDDSAARREAAQNALALMDAGDYLPWCESAWAQSLRTELSTQRVQLALILAQLQAEAGEYDEASVVCERAIALDPYEEAPRLAKIRYLLAGGRSEQARREYRRYQRLLETDLETRPSRTLRELISAAGSD